MEKNKIEKIISRFREENSKDPNKILYMGKNQPFELVYSEWLSLWIQKIVDTPSLELQLAGYCQHIKRWEIPRSNYPMDKNGYHKWRTELYKYHAQEAEKILREENCEEELIQKVMKIVLKKDRQNDLDVQHMEDALCLVTMEYQMEDFAKKYSDEKLADILKKVIKKMSANGIKHALTIPHSERIKNLLSSLL